MARRKQKQTLKEFRAWLQGVEELQPDKWHPDLAQWKLIRARIDGIKDEVAVPPPAVMSAPLEHVAPVLIPGVGTMPISGGGVPNGAVHMTPEAQKLLNGSNSGGDAFITDGSDGHVDSSFA